MYFLLRTALIFQSPPASCCILSYCVPERVRKSTARCCGAYSVALCPLPVGHLLKSQACEHFARAWVPALWEQSCWQIQQYVFLLVCLVFSSFHCWTCLLIFKRIWKHNYLLSAASSLQQIFSSQYFQRKASVNSNLSPSFDTKGRE